jgi:hypothetical protein
MTRINNPIIKLFTFDTPISRPSTLRHSTGNVPFTTKKHRGSNFAVAPSPKAEKAKTLPPMLQRVAKRTIDFPQLPTSLTRHMFGTILAQPAILHHFHHSKSILYPEYFSLHSKLAIIAVFVKTAMYPDHRTEILKMSACSPAHAEQLSRTLQSHSSNFSVPKC